MRHGSSLGCHGPGRLGLFDSGASRQGVGAHLDALLVLLRGLGRVLGLHERLLDHAGRLAGDDRPPSLEWPGKYVFRKPGRIWDIIFAGGRLFHLENTLGARYLDYLLHTPNDPILAFGLEVKIEPAKGEARCTT